MTRPTVRTAAFQNDRWTIGAEVNPWPRRIANIATVVVVLAAISAGVYVAVQFVASLPHP